MASAKATRAELEIRSFSSLRTWETWISKNHANSQGLWLKLAKKSSRTRSVSYQEALAVALCYGWIDGQKRSHDEECWLQRFGPRGIRSIWSKINRSKAEELIRQGHMKPPGLAAIETARRNGQWDNAYDSQKSVEIPKDLSEELNRKPKARTFFNALDSRNRYAILFRIHGAKKPETRKKRIEKFVDMLERQEKLYP